MTELENELVEALKALNFDFSQVMTLGIPKRIISDLDPLQQIFYGAPGTGKSNEIREITKVYNTIRTTFHPDSDYATFVGAYKPVTEDTSVNVTTNGTTFQSASSFTEKRISYKFQKQAFLKAYLSAWKKYTEAVIPSSPTISFTFKKALYKITGVDDKNISTMVVSQPIPKSNIKRAWDLCWKFGTFKVPSGAKQPGMSLEYAICGWLKNQKEACTTDDFSDCWKNLKKELGEEKTITASGKNQIYTVIGIDRKETLSVSNAPVPNTIETIQKYYTEESTDPSGVISGILDILNSYECDTFDDAINKLKEDVNKQNENSDEKKVAQPQFLIIEEINRGNCAQIFGDIFQLLDRDNKGFSSYPIEADTDLQKAIAEAWAGTSDEGIYKIKKLDIEGVVNDYTSNYGSSLTDDVLNGRVMLLPPNLYIWATMNTSDQSLFPIDSAFKRRWDWKYVPINYSNTDWKIVLNGKEYSWVKFQQEINKRIKDATDGSEDKQMGDFFVNVKHNGGIIDSNLLLNKIVFYLWNDVCKDGEGNIFKILNDDKKAEEITFSEFFKGDSIKKLQQWMDYLNVKSGPDEENDDSEKDQDNVEPTKDEVEE